MEGGFGRFRTCAGKIAARPFPQIDALVCAGAINITGGIGNRSGKFYLPTRPLRARIRTGLTVIADLAVVKAG
jgi:hypothetical protein